MKNHSTWNRRRLLGALFCSPVALAACSQRQQNTQVTATSQALSVKAGPKPPKKKLLTKQPPPPTDKIPKLGTKLTLSPEEWMARLTKKQFKILRKAGTEYAGSGAYLKNKEEGIYHCAGCNNPLFSSKTKFESGTGWPSYWAPIQEGRVLNKEDRSHGMLRTEIVCQHCEGHLGHVFNDGPQPTGLRYCVNSVSLYFRPGSPAL